MTDSIYQEMILDHYHHPRNSGSIENPSEEIKVMNHLCGDEITMQIKEEAGNIKEIAYKASGCAISIASTSMLSEYVKGKSKDELKKLDKNFILELIGIELSPNRIKCALLSLEALTKLINH